MKTYTVHLPPPSSDGARLADVAEQMELVADGFSPFAFLLAPIWMFFNRLWLALCVYLIGMVAFELLSAALGVPDLWRALAGIAIHLVIGFEADEIRRWTLARRGRRLVAVVTGRDQEEAEMRFLDGWLGKWGEGGESTVTPPIGTSGAAVVLA